MEVRFLVAVLSLWGVGAVQLVAQRPKRLGHRRDSETIHLTMLTDRLDGAAAALQSVCHNAAEPGRLLFHVIGPAMATGWELDTIAPDCGKGGAEIQIYSLSQMTDRVIDAGFQPAWKVDWGSIKTSSVSIHPALWDNSTTHNDPFNILRFYIPEIEPFKNMSKVLFMDDDVILKGDVAKAWDFELKGDAVMSASCHNWVWSDCDRFDSSTSLSYLDVPYLGFGRLSGDRSAKDAACQTDYERECLPEGFLELLASESARINGPNHTVTLESLAQTNAWNYGFNMFDLNAWRHHKITHKYEQWIELNKKLNIFPSTSLSYGLGIPMLAKIGHVQCFDDVTPIIQGLGFVGPKDMRGAGQYATKLSESFGLHYNGPRKPWIHNAGNPYAHYFLKYAQSSLKEGFELALSEHHAKRKARAHLNATSFVVLTDPRSGSEWFMEMLDQHSEICASGESTDGAEGFPREALIPARYGHVAAEREKAAKQVLAQEALRNYTLEKAAGHSLKPSVSLLSMNGATTIQEKRAEVQVPPNGYTPSAPRAPTTMADLVFPPPKAGANMFMQRHKDRELESLDEASREKVGGYSACQLKAACSWGFMANMVWRAANDPRVCRGGHAEVEARSSDYGFGEHLPLVCHLHKHARRRVAKANEEADPARLMQAAFHIFFKQQLRESLRLNDAKYGSLDEKHQMMPCKCPRTALVTGQKVMHDWIGDLPRAGVAVADWKVRPQDVNFNAGNASRDLGTPYLDLIGAMKELGTAAILFERENLLARFVSLQAASQSQIFHCDDPRCVEAVSRQQVKVSVPDLRRFVRWNKKTHSRDQKLLEEAGIRTLKLTYEYCREHTVECLDKVTDFLGVSSSAPELVASTKSIRLINNLRQQIINVDEVQAALDEDGDGAWLDSA